MNLRKHSRSQLIKSQVSNVLTQRTQMKLFITAIILIVSCSKPTLNIMGVMNYDDEKLIVINRNAFTLTNVTISLNGTYFYKALSITAGRRYEIILADLIDKTGRSYSLAYAEYNTLTIKADQGYFKQAWKK